MDYREEDRADRRQGRPGEIVVAHYGRNYWTRPAEPLASFVSALPDECDACAAKPGAPTLCRLCLAVRALKSNVRRHVRYRYVSPERAPPPRPKPARRISQELAVIDARWDEEEDDPPTTLVEVPVEPPEPTTRRTPLSQEIAAVMNDVPEIRLAEPTAPRRRE